MTKYKILTGSDVIYDSSNKYEYPVTEPVLNLELGEAGNLEFTILPGHPQHGKLLEMQSFVSAYQDDEQIFYGRVLQADEDIYHQIKITCEGALTFLLDSEMEPETYTETMSAFFARCINEHNRQVEAAKQFSVGMVQHEEANKTLEFKLEGYNQTRQVLDNLLTGKHGGFLHVRYENGQRYLDYIQQFSKANNQPIKTGLNVIDRDKHISGENLFTIVRPLGKNGLTIEGASSVNLLSGSSYENGKFLKEGGGDTEATSIGTVYTEDFIPVTAGNKYIYGPGEVHAVVYDSDKIGIEEIRPDGSYSITIPEKGAFVRLSFDQKYSGKQVFLADRSSLISSSVSGKILAYADPNIAEDDYDQNGSQTQSPSEDVDEVEIDREREVDAPDWNYCETFFSAGSTFMGIPGLISVTGYDSEHRCIGITKSSDDFGCDTLEAPENSVYARISFQNSYGDAFKVIAYSQNDNLISGVLKNGKLEYAKNAIEKEDDDWCYTTNYIDVEENTYYTSGPSQIKVAFYDKDKKYLCMKEANREGWTMHYVKSPSGAKFARVCFLSAYRSEQQLQKGKALILTKLDKGTKTILMPERIAKYGQIIHTEQFADIDDPQVLYNSAVEWISLHQSMLPASADIGLVDLHLLNPDFDSVELGDVYDNLEGFEGEAVTVGSLTKDMENPANDKITAKNLAELSGSDAGRSSGSLSSKYAASGGGYGSGENGSKYKHITDMEDDSFFGVSGIDELALEAFRRLNLKAANLQFIAEDYDNLKAAVDIIARSKSGAESRLSLTSNMANVNADNIVLETKNLYNIADNVFTVADTVFTHANLIWNEAKHIVTIAENLYTVADHVAVVADTIDIIAGDINILADNIRITMNEVDGLRSELEFTAEYLRIQFEDGLDSLRSSLQFTAEYLRVEFEDGMRSLRSSLEFTAEYLRIAFEDGLRSLRSSLEFTAEYLRVSFEDEARSLRSSLQFTAEYLRVEFEDGMRSLRSSLEFTAEYLRVAFEDEARSLRSSLQFTAEYLRVEFENTASGLRSYINAQADRIDLNVAELNEVSSILRQAGLSINQNGVLIYATDNRNNIGAKLNVEADRISQIVQAIGDDGQVTVASIVAAINDSGSSVTISADKVDVQANDLASWGVYTNDTLTAGVIAEKLTGQSLGNKTALRLLGDEIDLRGNTTINGFLTVRGTVSAPEFVLKDTVKIGSSSTNVSSAIASISVNSSARTLTYTSLGGTPTTIPFDMATMIANTIVAATNIKLSSTETGSTNSRTISLYDADDVALTSVSLNVDASDVYIAGQNSVFMSGSENRHSFNSSNNKLQVYTNLISPTGRVIKEDWTVADISSEITNAYNSGWNAALDAAQGEWVCVDGHSQQLYDGSLDVYVNAWVDYTRQELYYLPARK